MLRSAFYIDPFHAHALTTINLQEVLRVYAKIREPRSQRVWESSRRAGDIHDGRAGDDFERFKELQAMWHWVWDHGVYTDFQEAVDELIGSGTFKQVTS